MKHALFILTLVCVCNGALAQADDCQKGMDSAKMDFSKGILRTYIFGLTYTHTFGKLLKDEYGIDAIYPGDILVRELVCYSNFMDERIKEKFGDDIFDKVAKKSQELDATGKGDRNSEFPGGDMELMKFIYCNLDLTKCDYSDNKKDRVNLSFTIDTTGRPVDIEIIKTSNEKYIREAVRIIYIMPNWSTATRNGIPIEQRFDLPIVFDSEWKEKRCR